MKGNTQDIPNPAAVLGRLSAKKRFAGLSKEEISAKMKALRNRQIKKKKAKKKVK